MVRKSALRARSHHSVDKQVTYDRGVTDSTPAPQIGNVKITKTERREYNDSSFENGGSSWGDGLRVPSSTVDRTRSRSAHSPRRFANGSATDYDRGDTYTTKSYEREKAAGKLGKAHDDLYVVGYASVKTQARPASSEGVNYMAFVSPSSGGSADSARSRSSRHSIFQTTRAPVAVSDFKTSHYTSSYGTLTPEVSFPSVQPSTTTNYHHHHVTPSYTPKLTSYDDGLQYKLTSTSGSLSQHRAPKRAARSSVSASRGEGGSSRWSSMPHLNLMEGSVSSYSGGGYVPPFSYVSPVDLIPPRRQHSPLPYSSKTYEQTSSSVPPRPATAMGYTTTSVRVGGVSARDRVKEQNEIDDKLRTIHRQALFPIRDHTTSVDYSYYPAPLSTSLHSLHAPVQYSGGSRSDYSVVKRERVPSVSPYSGSSLVVDDLGGFALASDFHPTEVDKVTLPGGQRGISYTRQSQTGPGDHNAANVEIDKIIRKTKHLQDSMNTLEGFVKRNRRMFPEDLIIHQHLRYYLLSAEELKKMGERPDADIYGVKIREKLIVPYGSEVLDLLQRNYSHHKDVEIEYDDAERIRRQMKATEQGTVSEPDTKTAIRRVVESEFVERERDWRAADQRQRAEQHTDRLRALHEYENALPEVTTSRRHGSVEYTISRESREPSASLVKFDKEPSGEQGHAPQFTSRLRHRRIGVGNSMRFGCAISANPQATVTWHRGDKQLAEGNRYRISHYYGLCSLEIDGVTKADAGTYTVKATNSKGSASCSAQLDVEVETDDVEISDNRPYFASETQSISADVGDKAVFKVQVRGKPKPTLRWQKDGTDLLEDGKVKVISEDDGYYKLVIRDVKPSDAGLYACIAKNKNGTAKSAATLRVKGGSGVSREYGEYETSSRYKSSHDDDYVSASSIQGKKPTFMSLPGSNVNVHEGEALTLRCTVQGDPRPTVTWFKSGRELAYSQRYRILTELDGSHIMQIPSTMQQTDGGEYTVQATNACGSTKYTIMATILPRRAREEIPDSRASDSIRREIARAPITSDDDEEFEAKYRPSPGPADVLKLIDVIERDSDFENAINKSVPSLVVTTSDTEEDVATLLVEQKTTAVECGRNDATLKRVDVEDVIQVSAVSDEVVSENLDKAILTLAEDLKAKILDEVIVEVNGDVQAQKAVDIVTPVKLSSDEPAMVDFYTIKPSVVEVALEEVKAEPKKKKVPTATLR